MEGKPLVNGQRQVYNTSNPDFNPGIPWKRRAFSMIQQMQVVAGSVFTLFLLMAVGYWFGKRGTLQEETLSRLSTVLLYAVIPCAMINAFQAERSPETDAWLLRAFLALGISYGLYMLLCPLLYRKEDPSRRGVLRFAAIYGNVGFMGLPLVQSVLGDSGAIVAAVSLVVFNVLTFVHGAVLIGGKGSISLKKAMINPGTVGFLISMLLYLTGIPLAGPIGDGVKYVASLNTPLAMIVIGGQMAKANLGAAFRDRRLYAVSAIKLIGLPLFTALVLFPFRDDAVLYTALVLLSGSPTAGITSIFAQSMQKDTGTAARQITFSTLLCILTLPLAAALAGLLAG